MNRWKHRREATTTANCIRSARRARQGEGTTKRDEGITKRTNPDVRKTDVPGIPRNPGMNNLRRSPSFADPFQASACHAYQSWFRPFITNLDDQEEADSTLGLIVRSFVITQTASHFSAGSRLGMNQDTGRSECVQGSLFNK